MKQPSLFLKTLCITFALLIVLCIAFILVISRCISRSQYVQIDVAPLYNLELPQDFTAYEDWSEEWNTTQAGFRASSGRSMLFVHFSRHASAQDANNILVPTCLKYLPASPWPPKYLIGGTEGNRYCISSVQEEIVCDLPFLCRPTGNYVSSVVFQKGEILIEIREIGRDINNKAREDVIRLLAEKICKFTECP